MNRFSKNMPVAFLVVSALVLTSPVAAQLNYLSQFGASTTIEGGIGDRLNDPGCVAVAYGGSGRHNGVDGSAAAGDKQQIRGLGGRQISAAQANATSKTVFGHVEAADGSCSDFTGETTVLVGMYAAGKANASFYDTYTVSSETLAPDTPVNLILTWKLSGTFTALSPKPPNAVVDRGWVYFKAAAGGQTVTREITSSESGGIRDGGTLIIGALVGQSFTIATELAMSAGPPLTQTGFVFPLFTVDVTGSASVHSDNPRVLVTGAAPTAPF